MLRRAAITLLGILVIAVATFVLLRALLGGDASSALDGGADGGSTVAEVPHPPIDSAPHERAPGVETPLSRASLATRPDAGSGSAPANPAPSPAPLESSQPSSETSDADRVALSRVIQKSAQAAAPAIADCYQQLLKQNPDAGGTVSVSLTIVPFDGGTLVRSGEVIDSDFESPFFNACVLEQVADAGYTVDVVAGSSALTFTLPLRFAHDAGQ